jgi:hypothetical protein
VFLSLCDPFEMYDSGEQADGLDAWRGDFFALIDRCPNLDFLLLTKRPQNVRRMWPLRSVVFDARNQRREVFRRENVWLFYSASDQASLDAGLPHLLASRDLAPVLGLSLEPLVGPVDLTETLTDPAGFALKMLSRMYRNPDGTPRDEIDPDMRGKEYQRIVKDPLPIDWVIVGGESGPNARPCDVEWIRSIVRQCEAAKVPCFVKQLGANPVGRWTQGGYAPPGEGWPAGMKIKHPKGGDIAEWPEDLRVRQYPKELTR